MYVQQNCFWDAYTVGLSAYCVCSIPVYPNSLHNYYVSTQILCKGQQSVEVQLYPFMYNKGTEKDCSKPMNVIWMPINVQIKDGFLSPQNHRKMTLHSYCLSSCNFIRHKRSSLSQSYKWIFCLKHLLSKTYSDSVCPRGLLIKDSLGDEVETRLAYLC